MQIFKIAILLVSLFSSQQALARKHMQIVGSSTLYPFTTIIAEEFGLNTEFVTPIVESTGTGGGIKLFCSGVGKNYPDFVNASRKIKDSEIFDCHKNGIKSVNEIKIGYDGIVLANDKAARDLNLTQKQIFLALARDIPLNGKLTANPYQKWSDIDKRLPNSRIAIYGPPSTSGTRDAFVELVMEKECANLAEFIAKYPDEKVRKKTCHIIRSDGHFIEAGENDNLIVQKLKNDQDAIGIFGFSFLQQNSRLIKAVKIDKIEPNFDNIASGKYKISRPLFIYFKKEHLNLVPGMEEFIKEIINPETIGPEGYLIQKGLIAMPVREFLEVRKKVISLIK